MSAPTLIARVERHLLSDHSPVFDVVVRGENFANEARIGAIDEDNAHCIARAINVGASWISVGGVAS